MVLRSKEAKTTVSSMKVVTGNVQVTLTHVLDTGDNSDIIDVVAIVTGGNIIIIPYMYNVKVQQNHISTVY